MTQAMRTRRKPCLTLTLTLLLAVAGCRVPPMARTPVLKPPGQAGATLFQLDADASQIRLYLRADGPLARMGHSHVITSHGLQGKIWVQTQLERSSCELQLPVSTLMVDDPQERALAGGEFSKPLDDAARAGTREHMLSDRQLDALHFPLLLLRCQGVTRTAEGVLLNLTVKLRGHESALSVPVTWQLTGSTLQASGDFTVTQTGLGMEPYSALFGALRVADEIRAQFLMVARAREPGAIGF